MIRVNDLFESIITTILEDIIRAQDAANVFSARLAKKYIHPEEYNRPAELGYFPVPNSVIKSFDFSLRFTLDQWPPGPGGLLYALYKAIDEAIAFIGTNAGGAGGWQEKEPDLPKKMYSKARDRFLSLIRHQKEDRASLIASLPPDMTAWFGDIAGKEISGRLSDEIRRSLEAHMPEAPYEGLDTHGPKIIYDLDMLKDVQADRLCSISFKVELRNLQGGFRDNNDGETIHKLIPID